MDFSIGTTTTKQAPVPAPEQAPPAQEDELGSQPDSSVPNTTLSRGWVTVNEITRSARAALPGLLKRFGSLLLAFLIFYIMADYTEFTVGQLHPGELIFSNTMIQLWTATYRMAYVYMAVLALFSITAPVLWAFYRPDGNQKFDLATFVLNHLSPTQQVWLFFVAFWFNCLLFILLLMVRLPESVNVGR